MQSGPKFPQYVCLYTIVYCAHTYNIHTHYTIHITVTWYGFHYITYVLHTKEYQVYSVEPNTEYPEYHITEYPEYQITEYRISHHRIPNVNLNISRSIR